MCKSNKTFPHDPIVDSPKFGFGSWDRANEAANAYKDKWKSPYAGLSLDADVNPSNFQEASVPESCQDPRSIFGSDHQKANIKTLIRSSLVRS